MTTAPQFSTTHTGRDKADIALNHYHRLYDIFRLRMGDNLVSLLDFTWY